jgi:glucuronate isomerase
MKTQLLKAHNATKRSATAHQHTVHTHHVSTSTLTTQQQDALSFIHEDFLLGTEAARTLYHEFAAPEPIIDYHNHLSPADIACDTRYNTITQVWLYGDHYKWRAMRTNGVEEHFCTGNASDWEKFQAYAATVPKTLRNPLYHWTHLELKRYFGIDELLNPASAEHIYTLCNEQLQSADKSTRGLLRMMNVRVLCTTDDPTDSLEHHRAIAKDASFGIKVLPTFRPDKALNVMKKREFNTWTAKLEEATNMSITSYQDFLEALQQRHDYFAEHGCRLSDHGLEYMPSIRFTGAQVDKAFNKVRAGTADKKLTSEQATILRCALLQEICRMNHRQGWVQQFHLGALRNNNRRMLTTLGADTGFDSIGDFAQAKPLATFLAHLDETNELAKTILYNLNPRDNEVFATMIGNFQDGSIPGKLQYGASWWFLDQKDGIERQLNALSTMGLLSRFVGMLTDSRSFLSYPRHEYFRRVLCNLLGSEMEQGLLPMDFELVGGMVRDICYRNAVEYFGF